MEFNRECWIMLLGVPLDFWSTEHIQSAIASFGRVLHWEEDHSNLARVLVNARVTNLEDMPRHIVLSEVEGFLGQSWTIQCKIISQMLLGALLGDEDPSPDEDPLDQEPPFDFFGLGQPMQPDFFFSRSLMKMINKMPKIGDNGLQEPLLQHLQLTMINWILT
jgi:hypothetical protein